MRYELPLAVKLNLANPAVRLHHLLWHAIRDSWHDFTAANKAKLIADHPSWQPGRPRFIRVAPPTPTNPGIDINWEAGESFLFMHRKMIASVNAQLIAINEPVLVPWPEIPAADSVDYPVPDAIPGGDEREPKSDALLAVIMGRAKMARDPDTLKSIPLARLGAFVETFIHDSMHMRFTEGPGVMASFPSFDPTQVELNIAPEFYAVSVDYLGSPYSSHVNSLFWKLHGWVDETIEHWRVANELETINWTDTWTGDFPPPPSIVEPNEAFATLRMVHDHMPHGHHSMEELNRVLRTINSFENCHASFDYVRQQGIQAPDKL